MAEHHYSRCKICGEWGWEDTHTCAMRWEVFRPDWGDEEDPDYVHAHAPRDAAEKYCEKMFSKWEYPTEIEVWVRSGSVRINPQDYEWRKYTVTVEPVPTFSAEEKE